MARPKKTEPRSAALQIRVTEAEMAELKRVALECSSVDHRATVSGVCYEVIQSWLLKRASKGGAG